MSLNKISAKITEAEITISLIKEDFLECLEIVFEESQDLNSMCIVIETPTYNDGSPCVPTFEEEDFIFYMLNPEKYSQYQVDDGAEYIIDEDDSKDKNIIACKFIRDNTWTKRNILLEAAYESISNFVKAHEGVFGKWFGGNVRLTFYRSGKLETEVY